MILMQYCTSFNIPGFKPVPFQENLDNKNIKRMELKTTRTFGNYDVEE